MLETEKGRLESEKLQWTQASRHRLMREVVGIFRYVSFREVLNPRDISETENGNEI